MANILKTIETTAKYGKYGLEALKNIIKNKPKGPADKWSTYLGDKFDDFFDSFAATYKGLINKNDLVIIISYCILNDIEIQNHTPAIVHVDEKNQTILKTTKESVLA